MYPPPLRQNITTSSCFRRTLYYRTVRGGVRVRVCVSTTVPPETTVSQVGCIAIWLTFRRKTLKSLGGTVLENEQV